MSKPKTIPIDDAGEGMVLAEALSDAGGRVLLPSGATLSASSLQGLIRRGIEQLVVVGDDDPADSAAREAERVRKLERLSYLFRSSAGVGATDALIALLTHYRETVQ